MPQAAYPTSFARSKPTAGFIGLLLILFLLLNACGRKAFPVAPGAEPPPEISDLKGEVSDDMLALDWSLAEESLDGHPEIKGFYLYQAVISSSESDSDPDCSTCPRTFQRIARIPLFPNRQLPDGRRQWNYRIPLALGPTRAFKVNIIFNNDIGSDSNILEIKP